MVFRLGLELKCPPTWSFTGVEKLWDFGRGGPWLGRGGLSWGLLFELVALLLLEMGGLELTLLLLGGGVLFEPGGFCGGGGAFRDGGGGIFSWVTPCFGCWATTPELSPPVAPERNSTTSLDLIILSGS